MAVSQSTGEVTRRFADPYGNARGAKAEWSSGHGYSNAPESPVTGLTQLGARAYDPVLGRFLSVDPVLAPENPLQNNGYAYSHNNPVTKSDPDGKGDFQGELWWGHRHFCASDLWSAPVCSAAWEL
ncbi:RHS repeat-associated core domain-containing protein [Leifsonia shinshuensis]|uniref:RHS repeat-associated core domain-containing protein n=1 Tax=Leifsonia shinshuensis TaxID=150026 RepID=UPI001F509D6C|nr:RHS repeat-associated core domain-containing protein [Leifsonia shinshuensis]MCI0157207.1 RHS repeat-associated core domain-containing protein [Leifsonia shinshuensis]